MEVNDLCLWVREPRVGRCARLRAELLDQKAFALALRILDIFGFERTDTSWKYLNWSHLGRKRIELLEKYKTIKTNRLLLQVWTRLASLESLWLLLFNAAKLIDTRGAKGRSVMVFWWPNRTIFSHSMYTQEIALLVHDLHINVYTFETFESLNKNESQFGQYTGDSTWKKKLHKRQ